MAARVDAQDLAEQAAQVLGVPPRPVAIVGAAAVAPADVQEAVGAELDQAAVVVGVRVGLAKDDAPGARHHPLARRVGAELADDEIAAPVGVVHVAEARAGEVRREGEGEEAALADGRDAVGHVEEGPAEELTVADYAHTSRLLGHVQPARISRRLGDVDRLAHGGDARELDALGRGRRRPGEGRERGGRKERCARGHEAHGPTPNQHSGAVDVASRRLRGEALFRASPPLRRLDLAILRRRRGRELVEQPGRHRGDVVNRPVERLGIGLGGLGEAADLADVLQRGRVDLLDRSRAARSCRGCGCFCTWPELRSSRLRSRRRSTPTPGGLVARGLPHLPRGARRRRHAGRGSTGRYIRYQAGTGGPWRRAVRSISPSARSWDALLGLIRG